MHLGAAPDGTVQPPTPAGPCSPTAALTGECISGSPHTTLGFTTRYAMVTNVKGGFPEVGHRVPFEGGALRCARAGSNGGSLGIRPGLVRAGPTAQAPDLFATEPGL